VTTSIEALSQALAAEHEAIFGYGIVGAHLDSDGQAAARQAEQMHRDRRDAVEVRVAAANVVPTAGAGAYALPFPVTDAASALKLAVTLEEGVTRAWHTALAATIGDDRRIAVDALTAGAVLAARWRVRAGIVPVTIPFPGAAS